MGAGWEGLSDATARAALGMRGRGWRALGLSVNRTAEHDPLSHTIAAGSTGDPSWKLEDALQPSSRNNGERTAKAVLEVKSSGCPSAVTTTGTQGVFPSHQPL